MRLLASSRDGRIRDIVRGNGDATPFRHERCVLVRAGRTIPATLIGSERAVHIVEDASGNSAVCDYHRIVLLDVAAANGAYDLGLACYMGRTPTAERISAGGALAPNELATYHLRLEENRHVRELVRHVVEHPSHDAFPPALRPRAVLLAATG
jgi:hypothetical protein